MYTKAAQRKLERDVERANKGNFAFAAKLVRGAYMVSERKVWNMTHRLPHFHVILTEKLKNSIASRAITL